MAYTRKVTIATTKLTFETQINFVPNIKGPPVIRQFKHGQSNPTYYVAYGNAELVLRKKPVSEPACFCWFGKT